MLAACIACAVRRLLRMLGIAHVRRSSSNPGSSSNSVASLLNRFHPLHQALTALCTALCIARAVLIVWHVCGTRPEAEP